MAESRKPTAAASFPPAWLWLVDEAIPDWVKKQYSPRESWKGKPFTKEDAFFFFKGIEELSEMFTEERPKHMPAYFLHPKFRSSYLLYFLPLQAAKFLTILDLHPKALECALDHAKKTGTLRIADLGAGPGTASIALLLKLLGMKLATGQELPPIEFDWLDTNATTMEDGKALAEQIGTHFPRLRGKVTIRTHEAPWWDAPKILHNETSLILMGHVLNESSGPSFTQPSQTEAWRKLWTEMLRNKMKGGGLLMVEPASRRSSQLLSTLRDQFFESELLPPNAGRLWGPCLHAGRCPMADGRDWCHFSVPVEIPGSWFREFSKGLGSERNWVKFSYVWYASEDYPAAIAEPMLRRVISDRLSADRQATGSGTVLICEPETPGRYPVPAGQYVWRGDLIRVSKAVNSRPREEKPSSSSSEEE